MSSLPPRGRDGFYHPESEDSLRQLVLHAYHNCLKLRVRGSLHSPEESVFAGGAPQNIDVKLDRYRDVKIEHVGGVPLVTADAGCNLGVDPNDRRSTEENSLLYQLANEGLSFPDLGGITHQTVSGFTSTGSSGSTLRHSVYDQLEKVRLIDGTGQIREFARGDTDPSYFFSTGVGVGLTGVISKLTFRPVPSFHIRGTEEIRTIEDCNIDLFGSGSPGKPSLADFFRSNEYVRLLWWPLADPERVVIWKAKKMSSSDYDSDTGPPDAFRRNPYEAFGAFPNVAQAFVAGIQRVVTRRWPPGPRRARRLNRRMPRIIDRFVPLDSNGPQEFWDDGWRGLPMDNQINERQIPLEFTEMKIPLAKTAEVMSALKPHYERHKILAAGTFAVEIYPSKGSEFWMNPAFGEDPFVKVDILWFRNRTSDPVDSYFPQFWNLLSGFDFRLHWGKYLPRPSNAWQNYIRGQYHYWDDWLRIRNELDPSRLFVSDYWEKHLGI